MQTSIHSYHFHRLVHTVTPRVFGVSGLPLDPDSARGHGLGIPFIGGSTECTSSTTYPALQFAHSLVPFSFIHVAVTYLHTFHTFISFFLCFSFIRSCQLERAGAFIQFILSFNSPFFSWENISIHGKAFLFMGKYRLGCKPENHLFIFQFISVLSFL